MYTITGDSWPRSVGLPRRLLAVFVVAFVCVYGQVMMSLVDAWSSNSLLSYGFAVPLIAAYMAWAQRSRIASLTPEPDYRLGIPILVSGVGLLTVGQLGALFTLQGMSLLISLVGCVLVLFGRRALRVLWFPVAYLALMLPIWVEALAGLQVPSQLLSARIAGSLLHAAGVPTSQEGTLLVLPSVTLQVLRECSGVNQLVALIAMVLPVAYLWLPTFWRRLSLLVSALAIGYLSNGARIAVVGWLAASGLSEPDPLAPLHIMQGLAVSMFGYLMLGVCFSFLARAPRRLQRDGASTHNEPIPEAAQPARGRRRWLDVVALLCLLLGPATQALARGVEVVPGTSLQLLPDRVGAWETDRRGPASELPDIDEDFVRAYPGTHPFRRFVGVDEQLVRAYSNQSGARIQLYVGYYGRQEQGHEIAGDVAYGLHSRASAVEVPVLGGTVVLNEVVTSADGRRRGLFFWYDVNGRIVRNLYLAKAFTFWDTLTRRRANGAVVLIRWEESGRPPGNSARKDAIEFATLLVPLLRQHLPSEQTAAGTGQSAALHRSGTGGHSGPADPDPHVPPRF